MEFQMLLILVLVVVVILLDHRHNQLEKLKNTETFYDNPTNQPFSLTQNCRLKENAQAYNYPQPSDKFASVAEECISQHEFTDKDYYDPLSVVTNARMTGYPRQPRPLI